MKPDGALICDIQCKGSLESFSSEISRSQHRHINDLATEVLLEIFGKFPADFRFETLRSVCSLWREIIDRTFASINSIKCFSDYSGKVKFALSSAKFGGNFTETYSAGNLRFYLQKCGLNLKKFELDRQPVSHESDTSIFCAVENCRNLTELYLDCDLTLYTQLLDSVVLPELHTLTLQNRPEYIEPSTDLSEFEQQFYNRCNLEGLYILQVSVASFLTKHRKIANLCFRHFNPGANACAAVGNLELSEFCIEEDFFPAFMMTEPLFESLLLSSNSLESLSLTGDTEEVLLQKPFLLLMENFCLTQKLTSLHLDFAHFSDDPNSESTFLCLKGLFSLNSLHLKGFDFSSEPKLPQNWEKLTAGQLLAPVLQNLTELTLCGDLDSTFFGHAFSVGLTKMKKLLVSERRELNIEKLLNYWCPNLEEFDSDENLDFDFFTNFHQILHNCRLINSANLNLGVSPNKQLLVKGFPSCILTDKPEKFKLCGVKFVDAGICISRTHCF